MQRVKQTLLGPSTLSFRQICILPIICCIYVSWIPSRGFINIISEAQTVDYLNTIFMTYAVVYLIGCMISAILVDKFGANLSLILSGILLSTSIVCFAFMNIYNMDNTHLNYLILTINAFGSSMIFPATIKFIYTYFYPAQYDLVFIILALFAHLSSFATNVGIESLSVASMDTLFKTGAATVSGTVLFIILCIILRRDTDEKWFLSPLTVYDAASNEYDDDFCQKQIILKNNIEIVAHDASKMNAIHKQKLEQDEIQKEIGEMKEDTIDLTLQNRRLASEIQQYMKQKPKCQRNCSFMMMYALIIASMCNLSVMNCFNVFSLSMIQDLLPNFNVHSDRSIHEYVLSSNGTISSMIQTGMILALFMALFYRYHSMQAVYAQYKCSSVLVKLLVTISIILCVVIWAIKYSTVHPDTSLVCLFLFDALFIMYGICISYPIHVFCYVFLLSISGYNAGFVFSVLEFMMFFVSILASVAGEQIGEAIGWHVLAFLFVMMSIPTVFCYTKLSEIQASLNIVQTRQFLIKNKSILQAKLSGNYDEIFSTEDTYTDDADYIFDLDSSD